MDLHAWELETQTLLGVPSQQRINNSLDPGVRYWNSGDYLGVVEVGPREMLVVYDVQSFVEYYFPAAPEFLVYADEKREAQYTYAQHDRTWFVVSDWVTHDITDTRKLIDLLPGVRFQWDQTAFVKFTHRGRSEGEMEQEAKTFTIPPPSLPGSAYR